MSSHPQDSNSTTTNASTNGDPAVLPVSNRIIKRFGGRHLIFRTTTAARSWWPHPYALISDFSGPVWFFYGLGQVWISHKKYRAVAGWMSRVSRIGGDPLKAMIDQLEPELTTFINYCNERGIEGTIVLEAKIIEFHWTFGYDLKQEKSKPEHVDELDHPFHALAQAFEAISIKGTGKSPAA